MLLRRSNINMVLRKLCDLHSLILLLSIIIWDQVKCEPEGEVTVIKQGAVKGRYSRTRTGRLFVEYFGIPYGKASRFELAKPGPSWEGIRDGSYRHPPCIHQLATPARHAEGVEDCLFINVHTPRIHRKYHVKGLPVIVLIHGGFNHWEDQTGHHLGAKYFLDEDIVLVTFNYRLGPLGFLTTSDHTIPANLGLKDQVLALKWVQKNIMFFGGDQMRVTLAGYGSGAAAVTLHLLSPLSKHMFHRAIAQSGTGICPWGLVDNPDESLNLLAGAKEVNCNGDTSSPAIVECLKKVPAINLQRTAVDLGLLTHDGPKSGNAIMFGPVVEHWMRNWPTEPIFLPNYPSNLFHNYSEIHMSSVPLLIGVNQFDGVTQDIAQCTFLLNPLMLSKITPAQFGVVFGYTSKVNASDLPGIKKQILKQYFSGIDEDGWEAISYDDGNSTVAQKLFEALTHRNFGQCIRVFIRNHAKHAPVYPYYFVYNKKVSFLDYWRNTIFNNHQFLHDKLTDAVKGPVFGDELQYFYNLDELADFPLIRDTYRNRSVAFSKNLVKIWVNFAKFGKLDDPWIKASAGEPLTWNQIGLEFPTPVPNLWDKELNFWDKLFNLEALKPLPPLLPRDGFRKRNSSKFPDPDNYGSLDDINWLVLDMPEDYNSDAFDGLFEAVTLPSNTSKSGRKAKL